MGPFDDEEDAEVVGEVVEGQVVGSTPAPQAPMPPLEILTPESVAARNGVVIFKIPPPSQTPGAPAPQPVDITDEFLAAMMSQRSRAFALFLEVPFLGYIALHRELPGLVRIGAAVLGVVRVLEVTERQAELETYFTELTA